MENELRKKITEVIVYFDLFNYPLTSFEIWQFLNFKTSLFEVIKDLQSNPFLNFFQGFYFLKNRNEIIKTKNERYYFTDKKFKRALKITKIFRFIPWIKMIAIANIIGPHNLRRESDIDFFVITEKNKLWLSKLFATLIIFILNLRPKENKNTDTICLSFFIDETDLNLEKFTLENDLYFTYWLAGLTPIYNTDNMYSKLITNNPWLKKNLPNWEQPKTNYLRVINKSRLLFINNILKIFFSSLETIVKKIQIKKISKNLGERINKDKNIIVNNHVLKLHKNDRRQEYYNKYLNKLSELFN